MREYQKPAFGRRDVVQGIAQGGTMECRQFGDPNEGEALILT